MLNVWEAFLNMYHYHYLRMDGSTKTEDRGNWEADAQVQRGRQYLRLGINLTGVDTVIFYDNDCNPLPPNRADAPSPHESREKGSHRSCHGRQRSRDGRFQRFGSVGTARDRSERVKSLPQSQ